MTTSVWPPRILGRWRPIHRRSDFPGLFAADEHQGDMIYRKLGRTGERVSAIGLGGYHIGIPRRSGSHPADPLRRRPRHQLSRQFLGLHGR